MTVETLPTSIRGPVDAILWPSLTRAVAYLSRPRHGPDRASTGRSASPSTPARSALIAAVRWCESR